MINHDTSVVTYNNRITEHNLGKALNAGDLGEQNCATETRKKNPDECFQRNNDRNSSAFLNLSFGMRCSRKDRSISLSHEAKNVSIYHVCHLGWHTGTQATKQVNHHKHYTYHRTKRSPTQGVRIRKIITAIFESTDAGGICSTQCPDKEGKYHGQGDEGYGS
jgi:hypothetical protein